MVENNLKKYVDDFFDGLELYDDYVNGHFYKEFLTAAIDVFLEHESNYTAFEVYQAFFMIYQITPEDKSEGEFNPNILSGPNTPLDLVTIMKNYEQTTGDLIERGKNHLIHSINVFLLGLAVYSQNEHYKTVFKRYVEDSEYKKFYKTVDKQFSDEEFLYRWGVAALFHDIAHPLEIMREQLNKSINDSVKSISNSYDLDISLDFKDFDEFNSIVRIYPYDFADKYRERYPNSKIIDLFKPTEIMAHKIAHNFKFDEKEYKCLRDDLNGYIVRMKENNFIDHGFFSAILVLNTYGKLIQKYNKNSDFFFYPIVDSASAILLHNYYHKTLQKKPFSLGPLFVESHPIAFLLILCDELQEWNKQPFSVVENRKLRVNDLNIRINNDKIDVEYILNSGLMDLGFNKEKKGFLYGVLNIESTVFSKGLSITIPRSDFEKENMLKMDISYANAQNLPLRIIERLAIEISMQYTKLVNGVYGENNFIDERGIELFEQLSSNQLLINVHQAINIHKELTIFGCEIVSNHDEREAITEFSKNEIIDMAIYEHQQWCEEKRGNGWTYGPVKNVENMVSPYLVPWNELDEGSKIVYMDSVNNIPYLLGSIDLKVVRSKIRLLTFEMHKYYLKEMGTRTIKFGQEEKKINKCDSKELFDMLPDHVQYSNCKQANFIVKILNEHKYELVDVDDTRKEITEFSDEELECFAKCLHNHWYRLKTNLGWTYGEDGGEKTSPNLVPWDKLDDKIKQYNKRTFENLPNICNEPSIQLKIVK